MCVERYFERVLKPYVVDVLDAPGSGRANVERIFQQWEAATEAPRSRRGSHLAAVRFQTVRGKPFSRK